MSGTISRPSGGGISTYLTPRVFAPVSVLLILALVALMLAPHAPAAPLAPRPYEGTLDLSFDPGTGASNGSEIDSIAIQPNGKILIAGNFTTYNGVNRRAVARVNTDGSLDSAFTSAMPNDQGVRAYAVAIQPDGKLIIGGAFASYGGTSRNSIARLNADGSLDTTFDPGTGFDGNVSAIVLQPVDNKIIIAGDFTSYNDVAQNYVARLNTNGSLDTTFDPGTGPDTRIDTLALQSDGRLLIGGYFNQVGTLARHHIARLLANGSLDSGFDAGDVSSESSEVFAIVPQADGRVLVGGNFGIYAGVERIGIARANANGSLDTSFDAGNNVSGAHALALDHHGRAVVAGGSAYLIRLLDIGVVDASFDPGTGADGLIFAEAIQPDGKILIGGTFTDYDGVARSRIARVNAYGYSAYLPSVLRDN